MERLSANVLLMKCPNPLVATFAVPKATVLDKDMFGKDKHKTGRLDLVLLISLHPTASFEHQREIRMNGILLYLRRVRRNNLGLISKGIRKK